MYSFHYLEPVCFSIGEGNGNSLQYSCLENPVDRGAWWAAVHRVAQSWTRLKWLSMHACIGEGNGNLFQYSCLENPRDRAWWAAVYGVAQSRTQLKWLSSSSSNATFRAWFMAPSHIFKANSVAFSNLSASIVPLLSTLCVKSLPASLIRAVMIAFGAT